MFCTGKLLADTKLGCLIKGNDYDQHKLDMDVTLLEKRKSFLFQT
jgi:hypothetical protein